MHFKIPSRVKVEVTREVRKHFVHSLRMNTVIKMRSKQSVLLQGLLESIPRPFPAPSLGGAPLLILDMVQRQRDAVFLDGGCSNGLEVPGLAMLFNHLDSKARYLCLQASLLGVHGGTCSADTFLSGPWRGDFILLLVFLPSLPTRPWIRASVRGLKLFVLGFFVPSACVCGGERKGSTRYSASFVLGLALSVTVSKQSQ